MWSLSCAHVLAGHAANHLIAGTKLWNVFPPSQAFFSFEPAHRWFLRLNDSMCSTCRSSS